MIYFLHESHCSIDVPCLYVTTEQYICQVEAHAKMIYVRPATEQDVRLQWNYAVHWITHDYVVYNKLTGTPEDDIWLFRIINLLFSAHLPRYLYHLQSLQ